jgi:hypothetical protein
MRKRYLFLLTLLLTTMFSPGNVFAEDPPQSEYEAAMASITDGSYYIVTEVNGTKWYITQGGSLTDDKEVAYLFAISKVSGGALYYVGLNIDPGNNQHFSNTTLSNDLAVLHPDPKVFRQDGSNNRNDWERQVPFMNEEGLIAIRSCNTAYGTSSWSDAGRAFWTYDIADPEIGIPEPCYSYDPAYVWKFELPA